ncbi:hypothetical protein D187_001463 [Cystobacter fuscus DSM 2262]|uniref:Uncharacterized protein n=1 Tax=Cystobacter fuscus (strain ATCC 25194 / DSM 2262 / NBRC 100088 / M29) TaxID=1242864 RepID=S9QHQ1_CYSF2|nr:hypothetical protein D187_001463 [Cystobacter fuscus DSM 2262]
MAGERGFKGSRCGTPRATKSDSLLDQLIAWGGALKPPRQG